MPTPALAASIAAYCVLLLRWNRKINLTTITDPKELIERNFLESFFGAKWLGPKGGVLCDVGSGAGFPGLALKLVRPSWQVRLFEPNLKKAAFLSEVARVLGLTGIEVVRERWEDANLAPGSVDAVSARAVGDYSEIAEKARLALKEKGDLLFWIGERDAKALQRIGGWIWKSERLPESRERVLLAGIPSDAETAV